MTDETQNLANIKQFNELSIKFLNSMIEKYPDEPDLITYRITYKAIVGLGSDPKATVKMYIESTGMYGEHILTENEHFFKSPDIVERAESFSSKTGLLKHWDQMTVEIKKEIWEYVQKLYILGMIILDRKEEVISVIKKTGFGGKVG